MVSLSSAGVSPALLAVRRDIHSMKIRGAGEIGKQAALALAGAARDWDGASKRDLDEHLLRCARLLAEARPTAVTLRNALNRVLHAARTAPDVPAARRALEEAAQAYAAGVDAAKERIADLALPFFASDDVVLTHCHSTAAGGAIARAARVHKGIRAFSTETRPFQQGLIQSPWLAKQGVDVTLIVDSAVAHTMETEGVTKVVIGADAVTADGSLYNKIGTRQVALLAREFRIPVYVCAEREKFSPYSLRDEPIVIEERSAEEIVDPGKLPGVRIRNPVFDRTPGALVRAYVTDRGVVAPDDVRAFLEREFGGVEPLV